MTLKEKIESDTVKLASLMQLQDRLFLQTGVKGYKLMLRNVRGTGANPVTTWRGRKAMAEFLNDMINIIQKSQEINELHNWWQLEVGDTNLNDSDREHIACQIKQGFTSGQIVHND